MDVGLINSVLIRAIVQFQGDELDGLMGEAAIGGYTVPKPSKLGFKAPATPIPKLRTGTFVLDKGVIRRLKKDFLTFMSSAKKAKNYDQAEKLYFAYHRWLRILGDFNKDISNALNRYFDEEVSKEVEALLKKNKLHPLSTSYFPFVDLSDKEKRWGETEQSLFMRFKERLPGWEKDERRKARAAWKWLNDVVAHTVRWSKGDPLKKRRAYEPGPVMVSRFAKTLEVIEGFQVQMVGKPDPEVLPRLKRVLREYKRRASSRLPILLKHKARFNVNFESHRTVTAGGTYDQSGIISLEPWGLMGAGKSVNHFVHLIAHESGHHIYFKAMPHHQRVRWDKFWKMDKESIDLNEILAMQRDGESDKDFIKRMKKEDPVLMMRVGASHPREMGYIDVDMIKDYISRKGNILSLSKHIPSSYSGDSPHEFFAEVVGNFVGYGPRTVPKAALSMLRLVTNSEVKESLEGSDGY